jgi:hypothetical protein
MKVKTWYAVVKIKWANYGIEGATKDEAIKNLKESFKAQYNIELENKEIVSIEADKE